VTDVAGLDRVGRAATDGEIAAVNLESARHRLWVRFLADPRCPGLAEAILDQETLAAQFLGDLDALDRMEMAADYLARIDAASGHTALIQAQVASAAHRFADARLHLARAELRGASSAALRRQALSLDQACGTNLDAVLDARHRMAAAGRLEDLVPLGALLSDLDRFADADSVYRQALQTYDDVSPFPLAWVCFQLGMLWGELVPEPEMNCAVFWYRRALEYLPGYVKARVHLAEFCTSSGRTDEAEAMLVPVLSSGDPEVRWRLADVLVAKNKLEEAEAHLQTARWRFEALLGRHLLAYADHAAEFYAGSGNDYGRAVELARANVANRPTRRAFEQAYAIALRAGDVDAASELHSAGAERRSSKAIFRSPPAQTCIGPDINMEGLA
jgi:tetratricopeptide (TPR) repeat protein